MTATPKPTIAVPAETHDLTTLETVKAVLKISGTTDDDFLALLITQASAEIEAYCNRVFCKETLADSFRIEWQALSPHHGYAEPEAIVEAGGGVTLAAAQYEIDQAAGILLRLDDYDREGFWASPAKTVVTYSAGFVLPGNDGRTLPDDIEAAAIEAVKFGWHARSRDPLVKSESTPGVYDVTYWIAAAGESGDLPPEVVAKLSRYTDHSV